MNKLKCYKGLPTRVRNFMIRMLNGNFSDYRLLMDMPLNTALRNNGMINPESTLNILRKHFKEQGMCPRFIKEFEEKQREKSDNKIKKINGKDLRILLLKEKMFDSIVNEIDYNINFSLPREMKLELQEICEEIKELNNRET